MLDRFDGTDIDWNAPWFSQWRVQGEAVLARHARGLSLPEALNALQMAPVQFVDQSCLPEGVPYELHIRRTGQVPTRDNAHDFFNALCWMHFPHSKSQLNRLQSDVILAQGVGVSRGPVRDACTVFDENAALIQLPDELWDALRQRQWRAALFDQRARWSGEVRVWMFGHAALEKLLKPYKSITVHLWRVPSDIRTMADLDAHLARDLQADKLAKKPFQPLPILGVPGWWAGNTEGHFYDDPCVFRPFPKHTSPGADPSSSAAAQVGVDFPSSSGEIAEPT